MPWSRDFLGTGGLYSTYSTNFPNVLSDLDSGSIKDQSAIYGDADSSSWATSESSFLDMVSPSDASIRPTTTRSASDPQQQHGSVRTPAYVSSRPDCSTRPSCQLRHRHTTDTVLPTDLPATATTSFPTLDTAQQELDWSTNLTSSNPVSELKPIIHADGSCKRPIEAPSSEDESASKSRKTLGCQPSKQAAPRPARTPHKLVERRYRDNLKSHLDRLSMKLPLVRDNYSCYLDIEDSERTVKLPSKAIVIAAASQYIEQLESDKQDGVDFVKRLQLQVEGLQKMVQCDDCAIMQYMQSNDMTTKRTNAVC